MSKENLKETEGFQKQSYSFADQKDDTTNASLNPKVSSSDFINAEDLKEQEELMPLNGYKLIVTICLVNLFANSAYSSIAPFYPGEAI
jgi:hypothetical protein